MRPTEPAPAAWLVIIASSVAIGLIAGYGAVVFWAMIVAINNLCFLGRITFEYDANRHTPASPWGLLIILVPVAGAVVVAFLVKTFAPEAKGHGVPEVRYAGDYHEGRIRRARGAHHPDRRRFRLVGRPGHFHARAAAGHAHRGGGGGRHRRHLQYADRGHRVRDRAGDARGEPPEPSLRRPVLHHRDLCRPIVLRRPAVLQYPVHRPGRGAGGAGVRAAVVRAVRPPPGRGRLGDDARHLLVRGLLRFTARQLLHAAHVGHAPRRPDRLRLHDPVVSAVRAAESQIGRASC